MTVSELILFIILTPISKKKGVNLRNLLLGMLYNMPKLFRSEFQIISLKMENLKINPFITCNPISTKGGGVKMLSLLLGMSYNMPKMLCSEFQSNSIKIKDFKINPINPFNPISTNEGSENVKPITRNVL